MYGVISEILKVNIQYAGQLMGITAMAVSLYSALPHFTSCIALLAIDFAS
jgi:hypothetical protein